MTSVQEPEAKRTSASAPKMARQFVTFSFYKADPSFRQLSAEKRRAAADEFASIVRKHQEKMMILTYSTVGLKSATDILLWCISYDLDDFQNLAGDLNRSPGASCHSNPISYLSMTKHSQYVKEHVHEGQEGRRLRIVPGEAKYLFIYPFVKTRAWYLLPMTDRQRMMNDHIAIGHKYPEVKINTTYSFGLDDQEFVVAFETDSPSSFLDLVQELRETEASAYTLRDTPMFTCRRAPIDEIMREIG